MPAELPEVVKRRQGWRLVDPDHAEYRRQGASQMGQVRYLRHRMERKVWHAAVIDSDAAVMSLYAWTPQEAVQWIEKHV